MGAPVKTEPRMNAEEFMRWYEEQPEGKRYELMEGQVYEMQGERVVHVRVKSRIMRVFDRELSARGLRCEAFVDGMAVRVDAETIYEPDVLVRCGEPLPGETTIVIDPVIVVEVVSPSSQTVDALVKLKR